MAKHPDRSAPAPDDRRAAEIEDQWEPPASDQEFVFTSIHEAPAWVDRNWASFDRGPALAVPAGDLYGTGPYTTTIARVGDTVKFMKASGSMPDRLIVIPGAGAGDESEDAATRRVPQVTNASLEDALKTGAMTPDDLGEDAKGQVAQRTPGMRKLVEGEAKSQPKEQSPEKLGIKLG